ncbi:MAG: histone deacetylase [Candidatus Eiseniibacteriota bacterium]|nr:MAG: histone deacetylase [Candidatus Eisenbacteria bacterium]
MKIVYSDNYFADIGQHVFPIEKYIRLKDKLLAEKLVSPADFLEPRPASDEDILLVHDQSYLKKLREGRLTPIEVQILEIPFTPQIVESFVLHVGGTILAARTAVQETACVNLAGGLHHAFTDHGEGFCVLNDVAIAVRRLMADGAISRALIVDCDLHQGNGTAAIFAGQENVFTFSIHQQNNYPLVKQRSDLDIGLADGVGGTEYVAHLVERLPPVFDEFRPEFVIYLAGADPYERDQLGMLSLTKDDLALRDRTVMTMARDRSLPLCVVLAGGYAWKMEDTVDIHFNTVAVALEVFGAG